MSFRDLGQWIEISSAQEFTKVRSYCNARVRKKVSNAGIAGPAGDAHGPRLAVDRSGGLHCVHGPAQRGDLGGARLPWTCVLPYSQPYLIYRLCLGYSYRYEISPDNKNYHDNNNK